MHLTIEKSGEKDKERSKEWLVNMDLSRTAEFCFLGIKTVFCVKTQHFCPTTAKKV